MNENIREQYYAVNGLERDYFYAQQLPVDHNNNGHIW